MSVESNEPRSLEERVTILEKRIEAFEKQFFQSIAPQDKLPAIVNTPEKKEEVKPAISVALLSKTFHKADYSLGDSGDRIDLTLTFYNYLKKDVRAIKGTVVFRDLFDEVILRVNLTDETGMRAGGNSQWRGGIEYNQFIDSHQRLLSIDTNDTGISFELESVIYTDGTRERF
jgi:hypothetical protein